MRGSSDTAGIGGGLGTLSQLPAGMRETADHTRLCRLSRWRPAIAISAGETAPPRYAAGWSDTNPSAQMANHDSAAHSPRLLAYGATLVTFVFVLLIIIAGRMVTWSQRDPE